MMPPWAARWLSLCLLLFAQGGRGQLTVGSSNSFLSEDLDFTSNIPAPTQAAESILATDTLLEATTLPELTDDFFESDGGVSVTPSPEDEISSLVTTVDYIDFSSDFGLKVVEEAEGKATEISQPVTSDIASSEPPAPTTFAVEPSAPGPTELGVETSAVVTRPSDAIRVLADPSPDWLPIWPSHLLLSTAVLSTAETLGVSSVTPPVEVAQTVLASAAAPFPQQGNQVSVSQVIPSYTVTKVPVTQYFFDSSVAPTPAPGPLFDPNNFITSSFATPLETSSDLTRPTIDLASSIPELQSSVLIKEAVVASVTPTLPSEVTTSTDVQMDLGSPSVESPLNMLTSTLIPKPTVTVSPTRVPAADETEVDDNTLGVGDYIDNTTLISETAEEDETIGIEATGPRPSLQEQPEQEEPNIFTSTTASESLREVATNASIAAEYPGITGEALITATLLAFTTPSSLPVTTPDAEEVTTSTPVVRVSVQPTPFFRTSQVADSSRTPLWMLLSKSSPSQTVNTQQTSTQLISSALIASAQVSDLAAVSPSSPTLKTETAASTLLSSSTVDAIYPSLESSQVPSDSPALTATVPLEDTTSVVTESRDADLEQPELTTLVFEESLSSSSLLRTTEGTIVELPNATTPGPIPSVAPVFDTPKEVTKLPTVFPSFRTPVVDETDESVTPAEIDIKDEHVAETSEEPQTTSEEPVPISLHVDTFNFIPAINSSSEISATEIVRPTFESSTFSSIMESSTLSSIIEPTTLSSIVKPSIVSLALEPSRIPDASVTWTPVLGLSEEKMQDEETSTVAVTSERPQTTTVTMTLAPELLGGFTPIISEISKPSEVVPDSSDLQSLSYVSDIVNSTAVNLTLTTESSTLLPTESPLLIVTTSTQEYDYTESVIPVDYTSLDETLLSSVAPEDILVTSTVSIPKTVKSSVTYESESKTLTPSFDDIPSTVTPTSLGFEEYDSVIETDTVIPPEPSVLVSEILPSSPSVFITELLTTPEPSESTTSEAAITTSEIPIFNTTLASASASPITPVVSAAFPSMLTTLTPDFSPSPSSSADPETFFLAPTQTLATTSDLPALVAPTVTEATIEEDIATDVSSFLDVAPEPGMETASEEPDMKDDLPEQPVESSPLPPASPLPPTTTTPTTTTTKTTTAKVTLPVSTTTTPIPTSPPSEVSITFIIPTESMPTLTTIVEFPNGTMMDQPLPYVRALVAYSGGEFCQHQHKFKALLAEWISKHMEDVDVLPHEITFFNMPDCKLMKPPSDDHLNQLPEDPIDHGQDTEDKLPSDPETVTNVYFYITRSGKIDPYLTEQFPLFPTELEISEELIYLREKVSQLELVRPDGTRNSNLLFEEEGAVGTSVIVIIVISTLVGATILIALIFFLLLRKRGTTNNYYGRRCTPVSMDAYSMDSVSVYHSFRRKSKRRASGRSIKSYLNQAFDDPNGPSRPLNFAKLTHFISDIDGVYEEFSTIPVNMPKYDELPAGVEDKNRYANVIPVPETRVLLKATKDSPNSDYINANYVRGARNESKYYIATQAPLDDTVADFWRMVWEHETRVIVMLTDFVEKGIDKCADYLPPSETLDCHRVYGEFQVTLKTRDMKEKFVVSSVQLKNLENNLVREVAHMWFTGWPTAGVPNEESGFISFILEVRRNRKKLRAKGPVAVHCSPGTGRTGAFLACDIVMRQFEDQRNVDVARTVYSIRRDRAGAVQTKEQYAFIYRVINLYASKLTTGNLDSL